MFLSIELCYTREGPILTHVYAGILIRLDRWTILNEYFQDYSREMERVISLEWFLLMNILKIIFNE